ncbi:polysaccharide deacetylase [Pelagerythrobacter marensis]|uniref:Chitooligosaccharide deacetylase n=2 Tax=Pelagerythrobacter marensis TaxID=543877 RepID=A0A0G3X6F9_9SPHN|nr:polysaccharide deacetylase [Pelagerythrobacter marensis]
MIAMELEMRMIRLLLSAVLVPLLAACAPHPAQAADGQASGAERRIAITLDDAPLGPGARGDHDRADALIAGLRASGVQAAFFVTTDGFAELSDGRDRVARYGQAGHLIANHTHSHLRLSASDAEAFLADVRSAESLLEGLPNRRPWFRYPYLDEGRQDRGKRNAVRAGLAEFGLANGYVTVDTYDWHFDRRWAQAVAEGAEVDETALQAVYIAMIVDAAEHAHGLAAAWLPQQPVHTLLLHENDAAAAFLPAAIAALRDKGWTIVSPDAAYNDPLPDSDSGFTGMGRVATLALGAGARGAEAFDHWSASEEAIDRRLTETGAIKLASEPPDR